MNNKDLGSKGELIAVKFLKNNKYKILEKNYSNKFGEIDIIAKNKEYIVFVEVKTRRSTVYGLPCQAVDYKKQRTIGKVASMYILNKKFDNVNYRFDIIEVLVKDSKTLVSHIEDAFQPNII